MKHLPAALCAAGVALAMQAPGAANPLPGATAPVVRGAAVADDPNAVVQEYCVRCHNDRRLRGNLSLERFDAQRPEATPESAEIAERMIRKLRAGMMPPPGTDRPGGDSLTALAVALEARLDRFAAEHPDPGGRPFQRLNRAEYERSIRDLLDLEVDAGDYLPLDTKSANFDNIADAQLLSPTLLDAYLTAAAEISRLALGYTGAAPAEKQYSVPRWASQMERAEGAPFGTRGGTSVLHTFVADGEYVFRVSFHHETTGAMVGNGRSALNSAEVPEQLEISIDGERVALLDIDRWMHVSDPNGVELRTPPILVRSGQRRVSAAFLRAAEGPVQDLVSPHDWSLASTAIAGTYGVMSLPHLRDLVIAGPWNARGVSDSPSRRRVLSCVPTAPSEERRCAERIVATLAREAFRRPVQGDETAALMGFWEVGAAEGGFEQGVRSALEAILSSPHFVFRFEEPPSMVRPGEVYPVSDVDLASRLSYFLWGGPPDEELSRVAEEGALSGGDELERQARRMLRDPKAEALGARFAGQWLRLQDLDKIHPDVRLQPDYHLQLASAMRSETELFFNSLVRDDRSALELYTANFTFVNQTLAEHYGIEGVAGDAFQRVTYPDDSRRGLLGHGSVLTLTSHPGRTSPVLRGKWVMEVLLGTPPPPPPPGVPDLEETAESVEGRVLTTRERMEAHRANPTCNSCHRFMDPIGLALDNFDGTGKWRIRENGAPLDTRGELYDGTPIGSPADLRAALLARPEPLLRSFTENLMTYALGRRVEYFDQPTVRAIVRDAATQGYRMSAFILGVIGSGAFQKQRATLPRTVAPVSDREG